MKIVANHRSKLVIFFTWKHVDLEQVCINPSIITEYKLRLLYLVGY